MANLGSLMFQVGADTSPLRKAEADVKRSAGAMSQSLISVGSAAKIAVAAFAGNEISKFIRDAIQTGMKLQQLSLSFKAITGSTQAAGEEMGFVKGMANSMGQSFITVADAYKGISAAAKGTTLEGKATRDVFTSVMEASTVLGLSAEQTGRSLYALSQMISKGKVSSEELRQQLGENLPGAFNIAADAMGMTTMEFDKMLGEGKIMTEDFLPKFSKAMHETYGKGAVDSAKSAQAATNRLANAMAELQDAVWKKGEPAYTAFVSWLAETTNSSAAMVSSIGTGNTTVNRFGRTVEETSSSMEMWTKIFETVNTRINIGNTSILEYINSLKNIPPVVETVVSLVYKVSKAPPDVYGDLFGAEEKLTAPKGRQQLYASREARSQYEDIMKASRESMTDAEKAREKARIAASRGGYKPDKTEQEKLTKAGTKAFEQYGMTPMEKTIKEAAEARTAMETAEVPWAKTDIDKVQQGIWDKLYKTGEHSPKDKGGGKAIGLEDVNQEIAKMSERASESSKSLMDLQYSLAVLQKQGENKPVDAEWLKLEKSALDGVQESWKRVSDAQLEYQEFGEKLRKDRKGGTTPEAMAEETKAKAALDEVWATESKFQGQTWKLEENSFSQYMRTVRTADEVELAGLKKSYYDIAGSIDESTQATNEYIEAVYRKNLVDKPQEIAEWYRKLSYEQEKTASSMSEFAIQAARNIQTAFGDTLYDAMTGNFDNIGKSFAQLMLKMVAQAAAAQASIALFGDFGKTNKIGGLVGMGISAIGNYFSGGGTFGSATNPGATWLGQTRTGHAAGGPVHPGPVYTVGERGPELFTTKAAGRIIPNSEISGGRSQPTAPMSVQIINKTTAEVGRATPKMDTKSMVLSIVLDGVTRDQNFQAGMKRGISG
jgi:tape measure domain-containing protein